MVYKGNALEDKAIKEKVAIKLTEEKTTQVQSTLANQLDVIKDLAQEILKKVDYSKLEPFEQKALKDLQNRGYSHAFDYMQGV